MQTYLSVSKTALEYNARLAVDYVKSPVIAVVKCNGYGMGFENAVNAWLSAGVRFFAVAEPFEALELAELKKDIDILLMSPCYDEKTIKALGNEDIIFTVTSEESAKVLTKALPERKIRAHVKIDTGMGRFGESYKNIDKIEKIYAVKGIDFCGIFTHFALSFEPEYDKTKIQYERFKTVTDALNSKGINVGMRHCANSCAAILYEQTRMDAVRLGSCLIGRLMRNVPIEFKKAGFIKAQIADVKTLDEKDTSGYAMIYKAKKQIHAAVVELGFTHGFSMTRKSDRFRFVDVLRDILHAVRGYKHYDYVIDKNGNRHNVIGRVGNQFTLVDNADFCLKAGDFVTADVNVLMVDSSVARIVEE